MGRRPAESSWVTMFPSLPTTDARAERLETSVWSPKRLLIFLGFVEYFVVRRENEVDNRVGQRCDEWAEPIGPLRRGVVAAAVVDLVCGPAHHRVESCAVGRQTERCR